MSLTLRAALGFERGIAAVAGAGGKTTLLFRLADEARAAGLRVLVTTTTHMGVPSGQGPLHFLDDPGDVHARVADSLAAEGRVVVLGRRVRDDKVEGLAPARVEALAGLADVVLVEADGARRRSFKTPAEHEPVIPAQARLVVIVAGLDILGRTLDDTHVHRAERVAAAAAQDLGSLVSEETLVHTLTAPGGYRSRVPTHARSAIFLNKAEGDLIPAAIRIAARLVPPFDVALAGSARDGVISAAWPS